MSAVRRVERLIQTFILRGKCSKTMAQKSGSSQQVHARKIQLARPVRKIALVALVINRVSAREKKIRGG